MTNEAIIWEHRCMLMDAGEIGRSGRVLEIESGDGDIAEYYEPEEIHTYADWKRRGYQVRRGERSRISFDIWLPAKKPLTPAQEVEAESDSEQGKKPRMFLTKAFFFTAHQVEPI